MKKLLKNHIMAYLLAMALPGALVSCSTSDKAQAKMDGDKAYTEFRDYVTSVENAAEPYADSLAWQNAADKSRKDYETRVAALDQHSKNYDEARRQEIEALKGRYNTYWQKQYTRYNAQATSMNAGLAADFRIDNLSTTTAANIRQAYEDFIAKIQANKDRYTKEDWKAINDYYHALDDRKNAVQSQLSDKDKYEIGKAKTKYIALRTEARLDPDVSKAAEEVEDAAGKVGTNIKEGTKTGAEKVGNTAEKVGTNIKEGTKTGVHKAGHAAEKAGTEVKQGAKTGAHKVGKAAEKTGTEIKSGAKKAANKVDQKIDDDPENE